MEVNGSYKKKFNDDLKASKKIFNDVFLVVLILILYLYA